MFPQNNYEKMLCVCLRAAESETKAVGSTFLEAFMMT